MTNLNEISKEKIVYVALKMLDERGVKSISMRKIASELDIEAMSIYYYFPNKKALLSAISNSVLTTITLPNPSLPWDRRLEMLGIDLYGTLIQHPGIVHFLVTLQAMPDDPKVLSGMEVIAGALKEAGLSPVHLVNAFRGFLALCIGSVFIHTQGLTDNSLATRQDWQDIDGNEFYRVQFAGLSALNPFFTKTHAEDDFKFLLQAYLDKLKAISHENQ